MKNKSFILLVIIITLLISCKTKEEFVTSTPPIHPFFIEQSGLSFISPPPIMLPLSKSIDEIEISSQYFKIAVPVVLDRTGRAQALVNMIDEQFMIALDKTKRFKVMDKNTMLNITQKEYETTRYSEKYDSTNKESEAIQSTSISQPTITQVVNPIENNSETQQKQGAVVNSSTKITTDKKNISQSFGNLETDTGKYKAYISPIKTYTDGLLRITITGFDDKKNQLHIDYTINSSLSDVYILYSGDGNIGFTMGRNTADLSLNKDDIESIADDIIKNFPNPDLNTFHITIINGKKITVNAGKNNNIREGMLGYVVRQEGARTAYRALFEVTEVFPDAFSAVLKVEPLSKINANRDEENKITEEDLIQYKNLLNTIKVGEPVKMK